MYVHSDDTSVNLLAYVCDYSWGAHKMYALYIVQLECGNSLFTSETLVDASEISA
jgi:hypothetical protein